MPIAHRTYIVIIIELGADANEYNTRLDEIARHKPTGCPGCASGQLNWHGWYARWAVYVAEDVKLGVRRLLCKGCGHTISLLPSFVHRCRHYVLDVLSEVIENRVEQQRPWARVTPLQGPCASTRRRWVKALATTIWVTWLVQTLAAVNPGAPELDAHGSTSTLFTLLRRVAFWLNPRAAVWHVGWRHGWNAGVGRLM